MMDERVVVFSSDELIKARLIQGFLNSHGIDAVISPYSSFAGAVDVAVMAIHKARAEALIKNHEVAKSPQAAASTPSLFKPKPSISSRPHLCPNCNSIYDPDSNFCDQCGEPVGPEAQKPKEPEVSPIPLIPPPNPPSPIFTQPKAEPAKDKSSYKQLMAFSLLSIRMLFYFLMVKGFGHSVSLPNLLLMTVWGLIPYFMLHSVSTMMGNKWALRIGTMLLLGSEVFANFAAYLSPDSLIKPLVFLLLPVFQIALVIPVASILGSIIKQLFETKAPTTKWSAPQTPVDAKSIVVPQGDYGKAALAFAIGSVIALGLILMNSSDRKPTSKASEGRVQNESDQWSGEETDGQTIEYESLGLESLGATASIPPNQLLTGTSAKYTGEKSVRVNLLVELDFKMKQEVLAIRKEHVSPYLGILLDHYQPSEAVFGQIQDRKPWWGIYGLYFYGNGERSIEGPSGQSKFLCNPFVLVGLSERNAYLTSTRPDPNIAFYPKPLELKWQSENALATAKYEVSTHFNFLVKNNYPNKWERKLTMIAYNARDFGFNYMFVDNAKSLNVESMNKSGGPIRLKEFIHLGNSCGYAGGCNNISPYQPELELDIKSLPAKATLKLWKEKPSDVNQPADMVFVLEMI